MNLIKIKDANGKEKEISISDIIDMTTDLEGAVSDHNISDADKNNMKNFTPKIVDSTGKELVLNDVLDSIRSDKSKLPKAIDVLFEATHSGQNRNSFIYHSDSMAEDAASWRNPYDKPFLHNHDIYSEPMGRVSDVEFGKSQLNPNRDTINVTYRITDADAIEKFLDGRYKTMSIGGSVGHITCGICGKDIYKDGQFKFCGHWRGDTYNGQKALWHARNIDYKEGSVVNAPADDWAQVKKITLIEPDSKSKDDDDMSKQNTKDENILNTIDALADGAKDNTPNTSGENSNNDNNANDNGVATDENNGNKDTENKDAADKDKIKALNDKIATLTQEKESLNGQITTLNEKNKTLNDSINTLTQQNNANIEDAKNMRQQSVKLAVLNKKLMASKVADFEMFNGTLKLCDKEQRLSDLLSRSSQELTNLSKDLEAKFKPDIVKSIAGKVTNPGLANDNDENKEESNKSKDINTEDNNTTVKYFEDNIINSITKH